MGTTLFLANIDVPFGVSRNATNYDTKELPPLFDVPENNFFALAIQSDLELFLLRILFQV